MNESPTNGHVAHERLYIAASGSCRPTAAWSRSSTRRPRRRSARPALAGPSDIDRAVRAARAALDDGPWASSTVQERAAVLTRAGQLIEARADEFARLLTLEVGSPQNIASVQPLACKLFLDWHAAQATTFPWEDERQGVLGPILVRRQPVGVVGAIVPWNYPLGLSFPKLSPALLTGCTVVLKATGGDAAVRFPAR